MVRPAVPRDRILDAAAVVFARHGYHRASVAAIAREAGIADGTLYNHFDGKAGLLRALLDRLTEAESAKLDLGARPQAAFEDLMREYVRQRMRLLWAHRDLLRALLPELLSDPTLRAEYAGSVLEPARLRGEAAVGAAVRAGELTGASAATLTRVVMGAALGVVLLGLLGDESVVNDLEAAADATADLLVDGLRG